MKKLLQFFAFVIAVTVLAVAFVLSFNTGCSKDPYADYKPPVCNGCEDMPTSHRYVVNLAFTDHKGEEQVWPYTMKREYCGRYLYLSECRDWPDFVYQTAGTLPSGKEKHWYSWIEPARREDGMLVIDCVDGARMVCDYTSIQIRMVEARPVLPLSVAAEEVVRQWEDYYAIREVCPRHSKSW